MTPPPPTGYSRPVRMFFDDDLLDQLEAAGMPLLRDVCAMDDDELKALGFDSFDIRRIDDTCKLQNPKVLRSSDFHRLVRMYQRDAEGDGEGDRFRARKMLIELGFPYVSKKKRATKIT